MKDTDQLLSLIRKDLREGLTAEEETILRAWAASDPAYRQLLDNLHNEAWLTKALNEYSALQQDQASVQRMLHLVQQGISRDGPPPAIVRPWYSGYKKWLAAAAVILCLLPAGYWLLNRSKEPPAVPATAVAEILPGNNKAVLTLADGKQVELNDQPGGIVAAGQSVRYADSTLVSAAAPAENASRLNILSTAQGGQYRIVLPDGSKVWLNAMTTLKYPTRFAPQRREVELEGEAYFEVDHDPNRNGRTVPFIVKSRGQQVAVLGTSFNITAYADEAAIRTTLVKGSVAVTPAASGKAVKLQPGFQTIVNGSQLHVQEVDIFSNTAWKEGLFSFRDAGVEELMKQLRRWYGVEVSFEGRIPEMKINGEVNRNMSANKVFEVLDYLEIAFRIEQNKIIISNKR